MKATSQVLNSRKAPRPQVETAPPVGSEVGIVSPAPLSRRPSGSASVPVHPAPVAVTGPRPWRLFGRFRTQAPLPGPGVVAPADEAKVSIVTPDGAGGSTGGLGVSVSGAAIVPVKTQVVGQIDGVGEDSRLLVEQDAEDWRVMLSNMRAEGVTPNNAGHEEIPPCPSFTAAATTGLNSGADFLAVSEGVPVDGSMEPLPSGDAATVLQGQQARQKGKEKTQDIDSSGSERRKGGRSARRRLGPPRETQLTPPPREPVSAPPVSTSSPVTVPQRRIDDLFVNELNPSELAEFRIYEQYQQNSDTFDCPARNCPYAWEAAERRKDSTVLLDAMPPGWIERNEATDPAVPHQSNCPALLTNRLFNPHLPLTVSNGVCSGVPTAASASNFNGSPGTATQPAAPTEARDNNPPTRGQREDVLNNPPPLDMNDLPPPSMLMVYVLLGMGTFVERRFRVADQRSAARLRNSFATENNDVLVPLTMATAFRYPRTFPETLERFRRLDGELLCVEVVLGLTLCIVENGVRELLLSYMDDMPDDLLDLLHLIPFGSPAWIDVAREVLMEFCGVRGSRDHLSDLLRPARSFLPTRVRGGARDRQGDSRNMRGDGAVDTAPQTTGQASRDPEPTVGPRRSRATSSRPRIVTDGTDPFSSSTVASFREEIMAYHLLRRNVNDGDGVDETPMTTTVENEATAGTPPTTPPLQTTGPITYFLSSAYIAYRWAREGPMEWTPCRILKEKKEQWRKERAAQARKMHSDAQQQPPETLQRFVQEATTANLYHNHPDDLPSGVIQDLRNMSMGLDVNSWVGQGKLKEKKHTLRSLLAVEQLLAEFGARRYDGMRRCNNLGADAAPVGVREGGPSEARPVRHVEMERILEEVMALARDLEQELIRGAVNAQDTRPSEGEHTILTCADEMD